jgi:large subunit ribosomal protein L17
MRHRKLRTKITGTSTHNRAIYSNLLKGLVEHGRVKTTAAKARVLRSVAERAVTRATRLGDLLLKDRTRLGAEDRARLVHAMRIVRRDLKDRDAVLRLFDEVAPRYLGRPGGYTRVYKLGPRRGDAAPLALVEFVAAEMPEKEGSPRGEGAPEKKSRFGFLRRSKKEPAEKK